MRNQNEKSKNHPPHKMSPLWKGFRQPGEDSQPFPRLKAKRFAGRAVRAIHRALTACVRLCATIDGRLGIRERKRAFDRKCKIDNTFFQKSVDNS